MNAPSTSLPESSRVLLERLAQEPLAPDRESLHRVLAAIHNLGFRIEPSGTASGSLSAHLDESLPDFQTLLTLWRRRHREDSKWLEAPRAYRALASRLLADGAPLTALDVLGEGVEKWPQDLWLQQLHGLALVRTGASQRANGILERVWSMLKERKDVDLPLLEETLGTLARTHKDLGLMAADKEARTRHLGRACELYKLAFEQTGGYWPGINVATLARLQQQPEKAADYADRVREQCRAELSRVSPEDSNRYWLLATLGEAALIRGELTEAEDWYRQAGVVGRDRFGDLNSARRQARLLLQSLGRDSREIEAWLPLPRVAVFAGHMIDRPDRPEPRFPISRADAVKDAMTRWLEQEDVRIGYSSAACGSDILFQEALQSLGGESHIVLPYREEEFLPDSVAFITEGDWENRFGVVLERAKVVYASEHKVAVGGVSYDYANLMLHGLATVRARELETELLGLAVWDGKPGDGPGGTASVVERWSRLQVPVYRLDPAASPSNGDGLQVVTETALGPIPAQALVDDENSRVMAMLFADAVGFSKLTEPQVPRFVQHFLGGIAEVLKRYQQTNVVSNTWGDGLYLVFNSLREAGVCALEIQKFVTRDWSPHGLPAGLTLRIALHAGPVFRCIDPVTTRLNYTGTHVSRAARLEPETPAGEVYASEAFAALAAVENIQDFRCDFVKQLAWAKKFGTFPTYVVRGREA